MSTYDDASLATRFRALAPEPLPLSWDEVLEKARGDHRRFPTPLRSRRTRLAVVLAAALIGVIAAASASGTVRGLLPILGDGPAVVDGYYYHRMHTCSGKHGTLVLLLGRGTLSKRPWRWKVASGTGQYAHVTGGGWWRSDTGSREGSELWIARLWGTITSRGTKQRVVITLEGGSGPTGYVRPGRINPGTFALRPMQRGPLKSDSGSQRADVSG